MAAWMPSMDVSMTSNRAPVTCATASGAEATKAMAANRTAKEAEQKRLAPGVVFEPCIQLPQRIAIEQETVFDGIPGRRIGTFPLREQGLFGSPSMQQSGETVVSFDAARLAIDSILFDVLLGEFLFDRP